MFAVGNVPDFSIISCLTNRLQQFYMNTTVLLPQDSDNRVRPFYFLMTQTRARPSKNIRWMDSSIRTCSSLRLGQKEKKNWACSQEVLEATVECASPVLPS